MVGVLFSFDNEGKVDGKFVFGFQFLQRVIVKKIVSLDLDHQDEDLWEHRAFIGPAQMAKLCFLWFLNTKQSLSLCQEKDVISEVMLY